MLPAESNITSPGNDLFARDQRCLPPTPARFGAGGHAEISPEDE
jgi:hypothetical protein